MEEKEGLFRIFMDASKSMDFGTPTKAVHSKRLAAALSYCILDNSDRVILNVLKNNKNEVHKGTAGKQGFSRLIDTLSAITFEGENDLTKSIKNQDITGRGMSIIISDLYTDNLEDSLKYLTYKKQEIMVIHVLTKEEMSPEIFETSNLIDSESGASLKVTGSNALLKDYKKAYEEHVTKLQALCKKYSAKYILSLTDSDFTRIFT